jgi:lipid-binding SYLF domain-containing protein
MFALEMTAMNPTRLIAAAAASLALALPFVGCSTTPKAEDRVDFLRRARSTTAWFESHVDGLEEQIEVSAGYIVFPDVAQWGIIFSGGTWGRGALYTPDGEHIGWSALNNLSLGLQAGVEGFRMILVLEDESVLTQFKENKMTGSVAGHAVAGEAAKTGKASFTDGVAVYQGAQTGLIAGVNVGLDYVRYKPLGAEDD